MSDPIVCMLKSLPSSIAAVAARHAISINPYNFSPVADLASIIPGFAPHPIHTTLLTKRYWGSSGVQLTVGFLDNPSTELRRKILDHMNAWARTANVRFTESATDAKVRIARMDGRDGGYWSYLGTDIDHVRDPDQPTMNLEGFTMNTPDSEFRRVVRHEAGHTLGLAHEHLRAEIVARINPDKAITYYGATQGWSPDEVRAQVLAPLGEAEGPIQTTARPDETSIMCYQIPASITWDGQWIVGGKDISSQDYDFIGLIYPLAAHVPFAPAPTVSDTVTPRKAPRRFRGPLHPFDKLLADSGEMEFADEPPSEGEPDSAEPTRPGVCNPVMVIATEADPSYIAALVAAMQTGRR